MSRISQALKFNPDKIINKEIAPANIRLFAYLVSAVILASVIRLKPELSALWWLPMLSILFPVLSHALSYPLQQQRMAITILVLMELDALLFGVIIVLLKFEPMATLSMYLLFCSGTLVIAGLVGWLIGHLFLLLGVFGALIFLPGVTGYQFPPFTIALASCLLSLNFFACVLAYLSFSQAKTLMRTQQELKTQREKSDQLAHNLAKYVPSQLLGSIFSGHTEAKVTTERKNLTVFFSDIQGFTEISEELQPEALTAMLNGYFTEMSRIAHKYGGTMDKFIGDAILIFFGDPASKGYKEDATACVAMALEMQKKMKQLRLSWHKSGTIKPLHVRMGINTGYCTVGNFGAESRLDYTIIGREVNLASRLESYAEADEILISESTFTLVQDRFRFKMRDPLKVKGFIRPVVVYEVTDHRDIENSKNNFVECEKEGFTLYLDVDKLNQDDRDELQTVLDDAARRIRDKTII